MRYKIGRIVRGLINTMITLLGILTLVVLMITTGSVLVTTIATTGLTLITIPLSAVLQNKVDDYLSKYWIEAHKQGKEQEHRC